VVCEDELERVRRVAAGPFRKNLTWSELLVPILYLATFFKTKATASKANERRMEVDSYPRNKPRSGNDVAHVRSG
jgi:hypothetical protein